jgi:cytochrome c556
MFMRHVAASLVVAAGSLLALSACESQPKPQPTTATPTRTDEMKAEDAPAPMPVSVQDIMRAKTAWASALLEAVAMRNYELVENNAEALRRLSEETAFVVQDTVTYRAYSDQFRSEVAGLRDAATRSNQQQVEAAYLRVTETCFRCHEYVRSERFRSGMPGRVSMR